MDFGAINWLAVVLAAVAFFALGAVWYGALFSKPWIRASGVDPDEPSGTPAPLLFGGTLVLEFVAAIGLAAVIGADAGVATGVWTGAAVGVLFVVTALIVNALYEGRPHLLWVLNGGYNVVGFVAMGAIIGALQ